MHISKNLFRTLACSAGSSSRYHCSIVTAVVNLNSNSNLIDLYNLYTLCTRNTAELTIDDGLSIRLPSAPLVCGWHTPRAKQGAVDPVEVCISSRPRTKMQEVPKVGTAAAAAAPKEKAGTASTLGELHTAAFALLPDSCSATGVQLAIRRCRIIKVAIK